MKRAVAGLRVAPLAIVCVVLDASAWATAPTAVLTGPDRVQVGETIVMSFKGTNGDQLYFKYDRATFSSPPQYVYTQLPQGRVVSGATAVPSSPGTYTFTLISTGRVPQTGRQDANAACLEVQVLARPPPQPTPGPVPPNPTPGPDPTPPPGPNGAIVPMTVHLNCVGRYGGNNIVANDLPFAKVRDDPTIVSQLKALNVTWKAWEVGQMTTDGRNMFEALNLMPYFDRYGTVPALLIYDDAGHVYDMHGQPYDRAIAAPLSTNETVLMFKRMRGRP